AYVGDIGGSAGQDPGVGGRDVGVSADHGAGAAVQVPPHRRLLGGRLGVHVAEDHLRVRMRREDGVGRPERVVQRVQEDPADQVHDEHIVPAGLDHAPALAGCRGRVVRGSQDVLHVRQLADELFLGEDMVAAGDHVSARPLELSRDLGRQAEAPGCVLAVEDREVGAQLLLKRRQDRLDGVPAGMADNVGDEQDLQLLRGHSLIFGQKKRGARFRAPLIGYFAYSTALVSRTTVTRIWPGKLSSDSMRLAMSRAMSWAAVSSICSGLTRIRTSRPAWMAYDCWTPWKEFAISSSFSRRLT